MGAAVSRGETGTLQSRVWRGPLVACYVSCGVFCCFLLGYCVSGAPPTARRSETASLSLDALGVRLMFLFFVLFLFVFVLMIPL